MFCLHFFLDASESNQTDELDASSDHVEATGNYLSSIDATDIGSVVSL